MSITSDLSWRKSKNKKYFRILSATLCSKQSRMFFLIYSVHLLGLPKLTFGNRTFANGESAVIHWRKPRGYTGGSTADSRQLAKVMGAYWQKFSALLPLANVLLAKYRNLSMPYAQVTSCDL